MQPFLRRLLQVRLIQEPNNFPRQFPLKRPVFPPPRRGIGLRRPGPVLLSFMALAEVLAEGLETGTGAEKAPDHFPAFGKSFYNKKNCRVDDTHVERLSPDIKMYLPSRKMTAGYFAFSIEK
jgi:hypothetical protein